jgi:hypothetical protein
MTSTHTEPVITAAKSVQWMQTISPWKAALPMALPYGSTRRRQVTFHSKRELFAGFQGLMNAAEQS